MLLSNEFLAVDTRFDSGKMNVGFEASTVTIAMSVSMARAVTIAMSVSMAYMVTIAILVSMAYMVTIAMNVGFDG